MSPARTVTLAQLAVGGALLRFPAEALNAVDAPDGRGPRAVVRVLGARHLVQGAVLRRHHSRASLLRGAAVDVLHGASCLLVARRLPAARRAAVLAAALAGLQVAAALSQADGAPVGGAAPGTSAPTGTTSGRGLLAVPTGEAIVELRGGAMDGASVAIASDRTSYEIVDVDRGRQRYEDTGELTTDGWRVFALPQEGPPTRYRT